MRSPFHSVVLLLLLAVCAGCGSPFPPETLVERLRILGVRAEPPVAGPATIVELDALVADPAGAGRAVDCTWGVCLMDLGGEAQEIDCPGEDSFPLEGSCEAARLEMSLLVAWLVEQGFDPEQLPPDMPIEDLPLYVGLEARAGTERTQAIKRIRVALEEQEDANTNPVLNGLRADALDVPPAGMQLAAGGKVLLEPLADTATRESYLPGNGTSEEPVLEDFLFSWFSTCGEFEDQRTILDVSVDGTRLDRNVWRLPKAAGRCTLWLVLRDGRYGIDWMSFDFDITGGGG